jgi:hypothetical protein
MKESCFQEIEAKEWHSERFLLMIYVSQYLHPNKVSKNRLIYFTKQEIILLERQNKYTDVVRKIKIEKFSK